MTERWSWVVLTGLGVFHGINPAMGWLFAVALGLHRQSRSVVLWSLLPIALGHALAVAFVVAIVAAAGMVIDLAALRLVAGVVLIGWGLYHWRFGARHRTRVGMQAGFWGLGLWSFLMATAHGAGLMLVPVLLPMSHTMASGGHLPPVDSAALALAAVGIHTLAMLATTGIVALLVYDWVGLAILRRGWVNLDLLWTVALIGVGLFLLIT